MKFLKKVLTYLWVVPALWATLLFFAVAAIVLPVTVCETLLIGTIAMQKKLEAKSDAVPSN